MQEEAPPSKEAGAPIGVTDTPFILREIEWGGGQSGGGVQW